MAKVYVTRCIVKKSGKSYKKGSVMEGLTYEEIKQGLAEHWLEAVGNDEEPAEKKPAKNENLGTLGKTGKPNKDEPLEKMTAAELISKAAGLGLKTDGSMSEEALRKMIREAMR